MTFSEFKQKCKETKIPFELFSDCTNFLGAFVAEIPSHKKYVGLYYPIRGEFITVVTGRKEKTIKRYSSFSEISA